MNWKRYMAVFLAVGMTVSTVPAVGSISVYANEAEAQNEKSGKGSDRDVGSADDSDAEKSAGKEAGGTESETGTESGEDTETDSASDGTAGSTGAGEEQKSGDTSGETGRTAGKDADTDGAGNAGQENLQAKDEKGILRVLSEKTRKLIEEKKAKIRDGWLVNLVTGEILDPETGEVIRPDSGTVGEAAGSDGVADNAASREGADTVSDTAAGSEKTDSEAGTKASEQSTKTAASETAGTESLTEAEGQTADPSGKAAQGNLSADSQASNGKKASAEGADTGKDNASSGQTNASEKGADSEASSAKSDENTAVAGSGEAAKIPTGSIVPSPVLLNEFRFYTVAQEPAVSKRKLMIREERRRNAHTVGVLPKEGVCYILQEEEDGWLYVESGNVRGFVRAKQLITGEEAELDVLARWAMAAVEEGLTGKHQTEKRILHLAEEKIPAAENAAYAYMRATTYRTVTEKAPALARTETAVREEGSDAARAIGSLKAGALSYIIADRDREWIFVESGDVRGFVRAEDLLLPDTVLNEEEGKTLQDQIEERGEETYSLAEELVPAEENKALYYTRLSIRSGAPNGSIREELLSYAAQFVGNPYVWGGTDPVNGADCSGFVQSVYQQFGYTLPRTAQEQSRVGERIPVSEAQPGDLIFYGTEDHIYHVVICAGGDQTLEAMSRKYGIVSGKLNKKRAAWAVRLIDDRQALLYDIPAGLGKIHSYMGWQKVTNRASQQYAFRQAAGMTFDKEGFAVVDNRYVIACTDTFGAIGDYIDFYQEDGTKTPCIIGDFKSQSDAGCNEWGHMNGQCIIEFVVDQSSWYPTHHANPGTVSCHPEWHQYLVKAERVGSFYE